MKDLIEFNSFRTKLADLRRTLLKYYLVNILMSRCGSMILRRGRRISFRQALLGGRQPRIPMKLRNFWLVAGAHWFTHFGSRGFDKLLKPPTQKSRRPMVNVILFSIVPRISTRVLKLKSRLYLSTFYWTRLLT